MKKIIDGMRYNTESAEEVASYSNNLGRGNFNHYVETLYLTPRGNWFLHGEGEGATKYGRQYGDMRGAGQEIVPMTPAEAREWLERYDTEQCDKHFGSEIQDA